MRILLIPIWAVCLSIVPAWQTRAQPAQDAEALALRSGCLKCHGVDKSKIGPGFNQIASRYKGDARGYGLRLASVARAADLPEKGRSEVVVALVGHDLHVRIFDARGNSIVDAPEPELAPGQALLDVKKQLATGRLKDASALPQEQRKQILDSAASVAGQRVGDVRESLINKVKTGGKGHWTTISRGVPMPPFGLRLSEEQIGLLVDWVLGR